MSRAGALLFALFIWLALIGVLVLAGIALGWWATLFGALPFVVFGLLASAKRGRRKIVLRPTPLPFARS